MSGPRVTLILDDDVPFVKLIHAIAKDGYRVSNIDGFTFRVHCPPVDSKLIDPSSRRQLDAETDAQIRNGMRELARRGEIPHA